MSYPKEFHFTIDNPGDYERGALIDPTIEDGSAEYWARLKAHLPTQYPRLKVGDVVHNPTSRHLAPIVRVTWYDGGGCFPSGWQSSVPGYCNAELVGFTRAEPDATHDYVQTDSSGWARAHRLGVYVRSPVPRIELYIPATDDDSKPWQQGVRKTTLTPPIY